MVGLVGAKRLQGQTAGLVCAKTPRAKRDKSERVNFDGKKILLLHLFGGGLLYVRQRLTIEIVLETNRIGARWRAKFERNFAERIFTTRMDFHGAKYKRSGKRKVETKGGNET